MMRIVYISDFLEHHTLPLIQSFKKLGNIEFYYVAVSRTPIDRIKLGYDDMNESHDFVIKAYESKAEKEKSYQILKKASLAIFGGVWRKYSSICIKHRIPSIRISERFLKGNISFITKIAKILKYKYLSFNEKNFILLCCGHYSYLDFSHTSYKGHSLKFGYFPEFINLEFNKIKKEKNSMIWVGRFIDWKHPEYIIKLANSLFNKGIDFKISVVGGGPLFDDIFNSIKENPNISDKVIFYGSLNYKKVRDIMEKSEIHIFTSDCNEGWGAVLNESMNSYCIPIVNRGIGSSTYLIDNNVNGFLYNTYDEFESIVIKTLHLDEDKKQKIMQKAYSKLLNEWNSDVCAKRIIELYKNSENGIFKKLDLYDTGPLSLEKYENWNN